ncbi:MAG: SMI1/KNR4 family protein [Micromonosporaceae bacterium]
MGASDSDLESAELLIGTFPMDYRQFLSEYGWTGFKHYEIYGLGADVPSYLDVARMTRVERAEPAVPLPASYVCVMNDGGGNLFCFDSKASRHDRQAPIMLLGSRTRANPSAGSGSKLICGLAGGPVDRVSKTGLPRVGRHGRQHRTDPPWRPRIPLHHRPLRPRRPSAQTATR